MTARIGQRSLVVAGALALALGVTACGSSSSSKKGDTAAGGGATTGNTKAGCEAYASYGDLKGKSVNIYTGIVTPEDKPQIDSYKPFEDCTGAKVNYEGD